MFYQGMGGFSLRWLHHQGEFGSIGWDFAGWLGVLAMDNWFFGGIILEFKRFNGIGQTAPVNSAFGEKK